MLQQCVYYFTFGIQPLSPGEVSLTPTSRSNEILHVEQDVEVTASEEETYLLFPKLFNEPADSVVQINICLNKSFCL